MGDLYNICQAVLRQVEQEHPEPMDLLRVKGELARSAGFMVSLVGPGDPDDPSKIASVRDAARGLGIDV
jgi:hypothetical protein